MRRIFRGAKIITIRIIIILIVIVIIIMILTIIKIIIIEAIKIYVMIKNNSYNKSNDALSDKNDLTTTSQYQDCRIQIN